MINSLEAVHVEKLLHGCEYSFSIAFMIITLLFNRNLHLLISQNAEKSLLRLFYQSTVIEILVKQTNQFNSLLCILCFQLLFRKSNSENSLCRISMSRKISIQMNQKFQILENIWNLLIYRSLQSCSVVSYKGEEVRKLGLKHHPFQTENYRKYS